MCKRFAIQVWKIVDQIKKYFVFTVTERQHRALLYSSLPSNTTLSNAAFGYMTTATGEDSGINPRKNTISNCQMMKNIFFARPVIFLQDTMSDLMPLQQNEGNLVFLAAPLCAFVSMGTSMIFSSLQLYTTSNSG